MRILFLSEWYPYPPDNGSKLRIFNLLKGLAEFHEVYLISFISPQDKSVSDEHLRNVCKEIQVTPFKPYHPSNIRAILGFLSSSPRAIFDTHSANMEKLVHRSIHQNSPELVIASQINMASYADRFYGLPALFEEVELGLYYQEYSDTDSKWLHYRRWFTWKKQVRYLSKLLRHFRACTVVSKPEKMLLERTIPTSSLTVEVMPNFIDIGDYQNVAEVHRPSSLIFTGSFRYYVNHEAMCWFLGRIFPLIKSAIPDSHLIITGDHANLPLPSTDSVTLTGYVPDVRSLIASSSICVVPIRLGGGTRLKIIEAMALHTPVVTTSKGAEGLEVVNGEHLLIADSPEAFAEAVIQLLNDSLLRQRLVENAYQLVCEKYERSAIIPQFLNLVENTI